MVGHGLCGCCYLAAIYANSPWTAALAISLAAFSNDLMMGAAWATCQDIGQRHTAVVAGWMNMLGNLGGAISGWTIGTILEVFIARRAAADQVEVASIAKIAKQAALTPAPAVATPHNKQPNAEQLKVINGESDDKGFTGGIAGVLRPPNA